MYGLTSMLGRIFLMQYDNTSLLPFWIIQCLQLEYPFTTEIISPPTASG